MSDQREINDDLWSHVGDELVGEYDAHPLRPVERVLLDRYAGELGGRVLEIGVGGGRLTRELVALGGRVTGIDVAPAMVEHCRRAYPSAEFAVADLRDLSAFGDAAFDALVAGFNVLDVLDHDERETALEGWARVLAPGGLLIFSSHNLHHADRIPAPGRVLTLHPRRLVRNVRRRRARIANHVRLAPLEQRGPDWAVLNDEAHDFGLLHYYTTRDEAQRSIAGHGFALIECVDLDGRPVGPGEPAAASAELHYVARRA